MGLGVGLSFGVGLGLEVALDIVVGVGLEVGLDLRVGLDLGVGVGSDSCSNEMSGQCCMKKTLKYMLTYVWPASTPNFFLSSTQNERLLNENDNVFT